MDKANFYLIMTSCVAALGGFLFGYDTGIISGALMFILQTFPVSTMTQAMIVSSVVLGALFGALSSGRLVDRFGSKSMLICMSVTFIIGTVLSTFAPNVTILITGRFILGIAIGITSYTSPLFISEMAPAKFRGSLVLLNGIMITSGETIAFLVDYALVPTQSWRLMFATGFIPAILLFIGMLLLPASPRWIALKGDLPKAKSILSMIRRTHSVDDELNDIIQHAKLEKCKWTELFSPFLRPVLFIGIGLGILQQFVGINTVMYYGPTIFKTAGFQTESAQIIATFGMGLMNTIMTLVAVFIIDKIGRRQLLLTGLAIAGISLSIIGWIFCHPVENESQAYITFIFMMIYIAGYSLGIGSLFWLIISEIYPINIRGFAMSFVTAVQWAANFLVALTFLPVLHGIGPVFTFWIYASMCIIGFVFCYSFVPETRGISLEQIEKNIRMGKHSRELGEQII